jgi:TolB-like protein/DNA-binding winged helix-turn-helix (wHTH) protein/Flp pilus assembly protein TadD
VPTRPIYEFSGYRLDPERRELTRGREPVPLTPKAFEALLALVESRDRVAEKADLMRRLWPDHPVEEGNLTQQIFTLRKALGDSPDGTLFIRTVPRRGYRFAAEVRELPGDGPEPAGRPAHGGLSRRSRALGLLALLLAAGAGAYFTLGRGRAPGSSRVMLAVLPFANLSESADDEYLADGFTEQLITVLARLNPERLGVIARASVMPYRSEPKPVRAVGRELNVAYVLEGSVRHHAGRVRITAQLVEVAGQSHLWAEAFEEDLVSVFRVETRIAETIARRLSLRLLAEPTLGPPGREAHVAYLKGLYFWNKRSEPGLRRAIELFREAADLDPGYARAHAGLATAYARLATSADALAPAEARARAEAGARRALALDPRLPEGHAALAVVYCQFDWNWPECERELHDTLLLDPNYASGRHWRGEHFVQRGRYDQGVLDLARARELDPVSPAIHTSLGIAHMYAGRYDQALAAHGQALEIDPRFLLAHRVRGLTLLRQGRVEAALASLRHARELDPRSAHAVADLAYALGRAGRRDAARGVLAELTALARERPVSPYDFAVAHAGLGETEAALGHLERAYTERAPGVRWIKVEPIFDGLRQEPRFAALLRRLALPD